MARVVRTKMEYIYVDLIRYAMIKCAVIYLERRRPCLRCPNGYSDAAGDLLFASNMFKSNLRGLDTLSPTPILQGRQLQERQICDLIFAFLKTNHFLKRTFSNRKEFAVMRRKVFPFKVIPFSKGGRTTLKEIE